MPLGSILGALAGPALNFIGGALDRRAANNQYNTSLAATQAAMGGLSPYIMQNPQQYYQQTFDPLLQMATGLGGSSSDFLQQYLTGNRDLMQQYLNNIPAMIQGNVSSLYDTPYAATGRAFDGAIGGAGNLMNGILQDPRYNNMFDYLSQFGQGNSTAANTLGGVGADLANGRGQTAYNLTGIDNAGMAQARGGYNPQGQNFYDAGNSLFSAGGSSPGLDSLFNFANSSMPGLLPGNVQRASQSDMLGGAGNAAIAGLMSQASTPFSQMMQLAGQGTGGSYNVPMAQQGIGQGQINAAFNQGLQNGYTGQNMTTFGQGTQGLDQLLARNGDLDNINSAAMQAFSGNLPGGDPYGGTLSSIIGALTGGGGGGFNIGGVGGGGASGASAGSIGPMDAELAKFRDRGLQYFNNNPLLSMDEMSAMARDSAATAARQRAEQVQRYAAARGGGGFLTNSGAQNQTFADFAEEMAQAEAQAVTQARLRQQELGLQQQMQGAQVGLDAVQADNARQQIQASRDIASANNATQASVANASSQTQAGIANMNAQIAAQQARNQALASAAQTALGARGQNYDRSAAGLNALLQNQQVANQRGDIFGQAALGSLNDATNRYGAGLSILPGLAQNNTSQQLGLTNAALQSQLGNRELDNSRYATNLNAATQYGLGNSQIQSGNLQAALTGALQGSNLSNNLYGLQTGANNQALGTLMQGALGSQDAMTQRIGQGLNAMGAAGQNANNNLSIFGNIGNAAEQSQLGRMGLGADMMNSGMNSQLNAFNMLQGGLANQYTGGINAGNLLNNSLTQQGNIYGGLQQFDLGRQQLGQTAYNNYFQNALGLGNLGLGGASTGMNALGGLNSGILGNMNTGLGAYSNIARGLSPQGQQQVGALPQVNLQGMGSFFGGLGGNSGNNMSLGNIFGTGGYYGV